MNSYESLRHEIKVARKLGYDTLTIPVDMIAQLLDESERDQRNAAASQQEASDLLDKIDEQEQKIEELRADNAKLRRAEQRAVSTLVEVRRSLNRGQ